MEKISIFLKKKFKISGNESGDGADLEKISTNRRKKNNLLSNSNSNGKNPINNNLLEYVAFAFSTIRSDNYFPIHQINFTTILPTNEQSRSYQSCSKLSPILSSCSASIILSSSSSDSFTSDLEGIDYSQQEDEDEDFDFEARNKIRELIQGLEKYYSFSPKKQNELTPSAFNNDNDTVEGKIYKFMIPVEILKNQVLNYCSRQLFHIVPASLSNFKLITCLQLCCNSLTELPEEICLLKRLEILNLSNNRLKSIPSTIGYLKNLEQILLDRNQLKALPYSMNGLTKLKIISIAANEFEMVPKSLMSLTRLVTLECDRNPNLLCAPAEIVRFSQITRFHMEECSKLLKESEYKQFEKDRSSSHPLPSLLECSARSLIRNKRPVLFSLPRHLKLFLSRAEECSFCSGPMIDFKVIRCRTIKRMERIIPIVDELCSAHWVDEKERINTIFSKYPATTPTNLISSDRRSRTGPSAPFNQFDADKMARGRRIMKKVDTENIGQLLVPLSLVVDWPEYPSL